MSNLIPLFLSMSALSWSESWKIQSLFSAELQGEFTPGGKPVHRRPVSLFNQLKHTFNYSHPKVLYKYWILFVQA